jgi:hypothetical protein
VSERAEEGRAFSRWVWLYFGNKLVEMELAGEYSVSCQPHDVTKLQSTTPHISN